MLSFFNWMQEKYRLRNGEYRNSRFGDLAYDMTRDSSFPRDSSDMEQLEDHFVRVCRCNDALITAKEALKNYAKDQLQL